MPELDGWLFGETLVRGVCAYAVILLYLRVSGNRTLAKLRAFDFVVTIALGTLLGTTIVSRSVPLWQGLAAIALLIALQWLVARTAVASSAFNRVVTSESIRVFRDGIFDEAAMRRARITRDEVEAAFRQAGLRDGARVESAWLEVNGSLSVVKRSP